MMALCIHKTAIDAAIRRSQKDLTFKNGCRVQEMSFTWEMNGYLFAYKMSASATPVKRVFDGFNFPSTADHISFAVVLYVLHGAARRQATSLLISCPSTQVSQTAFARSCMVCQTLQGKNAGRLEEGMQGWG